MTLPERIREPLDELLDALEAKGSGNVAIYAQGLVDRLGGNRSVSYMEPTEAAIYVACLLARALDIRPPDADITTRLAKEAGFKDTNNDGDWWSDSPHESIKRLIALVAEECAKVIEEQNEDHATIGRLAFAVRKRFKA